MKRALLGMAYVFCSFLYVSNAAAITINYSAVEAGHIEFDPADNCSGSTGVVGCFSFTPGSSSTSFQITSTSSATQPASGLLGRIDGIFSVLDPININGILETADVSGTGTLTIIDDDSIQLTASLAWIDIATVGTFGGANIEGAANLTSISYAGTNTDLIALAATGTGVQTATFQFTTQESLTDLFTTSNSVTKTSFSGSISAVPVPAAFWLFASGVLGIVTVARKRK
jgi:hypothetical protein